MDNPNNKDLNQRVQASPETQQSEKQNFKPFIITMCVLGVILLGCVFLGIASKNLGNVMATVGSVALAILVLLVMITVHELGHYLTGKWLGFGITEFALGFGPAIYKKKRKNGEYFSIRALPIGGFCAFEGEDEDSTSPTAFNNRKPWQRIIVLIAGASMNFILSLLIIALFFGVYGQSLITAFEVAPTTKYSQTLEGGDVIVEIEGKDVYLQTDLIRALKGKKEGEVVNVKVYRENTGEFIDKKITLQTDVTSTNSTDIYGLSRALGIAQLLCIDQTEETSPFKKGDAIFRECTSDYQNDSDNPDGKYLKEKRIYTEQDLYNYLSSFSAGDTVKLWIYRGEDYFRLEFVLPESFASATEQTTFECLGVNAISTQERWTTTNVSLGFFRTITGTFVYAFKLAGTIFTVLGELITGALGLNAMGGTVTTVVVTSRAIRVGGLSFLLEIASCIGVNLAVFNLLPIPALDGSRVVFTLIEWIFRKPVNKNVEGIIHTVGLVLLLGFAVMVDLMQLF